MNWMVEVRGQRDAWHVIVSEDQAKAMQADGFTAYEAVNTIPAWIENAGLTWFWCRAQDMWNFPSRAWRKVWGSK